MVRRGFDMDGTLCEAPFIPGDKFRTLTEEEFQSRKEEIKQFHLTAPQLLIPPRGMFYVITGRRQECAEATRSWLRKHFPDLDWLMILHEGGPRDYEHMLAFKRRWIIDLELEEFTDDDPKLVADLRKVLPWVRIFHFDGQVSRYG